MAQLCGVHLARSKVLGDVPITVIAWAAPKIGNPYLAKWVENQHPRLRILRISVTDDVVTKGAISKHARLLSVCHPQLVRIYAFVVKGKHQCFSSCARIMEDH